MSQAQPLFPVRFAPPWPFIPGARYEESPGSTALRRAGVLWATRAHDLAPGGDLRGCYRYALHRTWNAQARVLLALGMNPSTATADEDDPTVRVLEGYARRQGYGALWIGNAAAYRSAFPAAVGEARARGADIVGPRNAEVLRALVRHELLPDVLACWGAAPELRQECAAVYQLVAELAPSRTYVLDLTASGQPRHPLRGGTSNPLRRLWPDPVLQEHAAATVAGSVPESP